MKALCLLLFLLLPLQAESPANVVLPTDNKYLFTDQPQKFYMYTDRSFNGISSKPWTAGQYGFVRNLKHTNEGVLATKFHEGIDIRPMRRDKGQRPLDKIYAIAPGKVVYTNDIAGNSSYGRYLVIEHNWGSGAFYSLYAHLHSIECQTGQTVRAGQTIAQMGYTGSGINRERAHLHLELNVMTNQYYNHYTPNKHGNYNGLNMNGLNIAELLKRSRADKSLTISRFLTKVPVYFKITVPRTGFIDLSRRYTWIRRGNYSSHSPSWEISFASSGFPLAIQPSIRKVTEPTVTYVTPTKSNHLYYTKGILTGSKSSASLTSRGKSWIDRILKDKPRIQPKTKATQDPDASIPPKKSTTPMTKTKY